MSCLKSLHDGQVMELMGYETSEQLEHSGEVQGAGSQTGQIYLRRTAR